MVGLAITIEIIFIGLSMFFHDWTWFGRSGGVLTLIGGILAARRLIRLGVVGLIFHEEHFDGGTFGDTEKAKKEEDDKNHKRKDIRAGRFAFYLIFVGTLIWTFGDLLNCLCGKK